MRSALIWSALAVISIISSLDWFFRKKLLDYMTYDTLFAVSSGSAAVAMVIVTIISVLVNKKTIVEDVKRFKTWHWLIITVTPLILAGSYWLGLKALNESPVSFFAPSRSLIVIVVVALFGFFLLNEKLSPVTYVALGVMAVALIMLIIQTCVYKKF